MGVALGFSLVRWRETESRPLNLSRTSVTRAPAGCPARNARNRVVDEMAEGFDPLPYPLQGVAAMDGYMAAVRNDRADFFPFGRVRGFGSSRTASQPVRS